VGLGSAEHWLGQERDELLGGRETLSQFYDLVRIITIYFTVIQNLIISIFGDNYRTGMGEGGREDKITE